MALFRTGCTRGKFVVSASDMLSGSAVRRRGIGSVSGLKSLGFEDEERGTDEVVILRREKDSWSASSGGLDIMT